MRTFMQVCAITVFIVTGTAAPVSADGVIGPDHTLARQQLDDHVWIEISGRDVEVGEEGTLDVMIWTTTALAPPSPFQVKHRLKDFDLLLSTSRGFLEFPSPPVYRIKDLQGNWHELEDGGSGSLDLRPVAGLLLETIIRGIPYVGPAYSFLENVDATIRWLAAEPTNWLAVWSAVRDQDDFLVPYPDGASPDEKFEIVRIEIPFRKTDERGWCRLVAEGVNYIWVNPGETGRPAWLSLTTPTQVFHLFGDTESSAPPLHAVDGPLHAELIAEHVSGSGVDVDYSVVREDDGSWLRFKVEAEDDERLSNVRCALQVGKGRIALRGLPVFRNGAGEIVDHLSDRELGASAVAFGWGMWGAGAVAHAQGLDLTEAGIELTESTHDLFHLLGDATQRHTLPNIAHQWNLQFQTDTYVLPTYGQRSLDRDAPGGFELSIPIDRFIDDPGPLVVTLGCTRYRDRSQDGPNNISGSTAWEPPPETIVTGLVALKPVAAVDEPEWQDHWMKTGTELQLFGWSDDEKYWAFGESGDYSGGALCGITVRRFIIEAARNSFHWKDEWDVTERKGFHENATIDAEVEGIERSFRRRLDGLGFRGETGRVVYEKPPAVWTGGDMAIRQFGEVNASFTLDGERFEVKLDDRIEKGRDGWDTKSGFRISIRGNGGGWKVLQADDTPWRDFIQYRILYVSVSPSKRKVAIVVEAVQYGFEASKICYYKGITGTMP